MASPLTGAVLIISNEPDMNGGAQCGEEVSDELAMEEIIEFECGDGITGQYVSVLIPNVTTTLSLCEVEIYAPLRRRFELVGSTNTWAEAKSLCSSRGGHLAKIENAEDQSYIVGLIGQSGLSPLTYGWYIGLNDRAIEGTRVWEDGSSLVGYTNWHPTEPNDGGNWGNGEDCTEISRDYNFKWNDVACSSSLFAICQYDDAW
ncbi:perlucin-like [Saccoglossus kowalevskii]